MLKLFVLNTFMVKKMEEYGSGTQTSGTHAYMIVYDGGVFVKDMRNGFPYLNFRAVKDP